ncbi:MAG: response regulator [Gammaproteobacteria bacterium]|nr:response regulator [Gammaproteobacteria bacterium]
MSTQNKILIVDDEAAIRTMLRCALEPAGFTVIDLADCTQAWRLLQAKNAVDLLLLDWMLPDQSGIEFAKRLRAQLATADLPIIMLTAKAEERNKLKGLEEARVDDYITKPFSIRELIARINTVLRRGPVQNHEGRIQFAALALNLDHKTLLINNQEINITPKLYAILYFFLTHRDKVYTRQQLLDNLAADSFYDERTIDRQIKRLRDLLEPSGMADYLITVRGHGYQFTSKKQC